LSDDSLLLEIASDCIWVKMKKKRNLPVLLSEMEKFKECVYPWMDGEKLRFVGASSIGILSQFFSMQISE